MQLDDWLNTPNPDASRKERGKFAARIGVTPQMISAYCKGTFPSPARLKKIEVETDGQVTANDFMASRESIPSEPEQAESSS